jgi:hypothetical protein
VYFNYDILKNHFLSNKYYKKVSWVLQNFLTMECYRKLCNKCYWKNIQPHSSNYTRRSFLIFLSIVLSVFFSFFYSPNDPANTNSSSYLIRLISYICILKVHVRNLTKRFTSWLYFCLYCLENVYSSHVFKSNHYNLALRSSWLI